MDPDRVKAVQLVLVLGTGLAGALAAQAIGLPIPFLLGSLSFTAVLSLVLFARTGQRLWYPQALRKVCIAVIGTMIGTTFAPEVLSVLPGMLLTLPAMLLFILAAQGVNFVIFRRLAGYDAPTAFYAAMPGGLVEAVLLGEKAGGNAEILSVQHFARIVMVVIAVPGVFYLATGEIVGSAGGQTLESRVPAWTDWAAFAVLAPAGMFLGDKLRLPAAHMVGPLVLSALLHGAGVLDVAGPAVLLNGAQLVVGAGLGVMFARSTLPQLAVCFGFGAVSIAVTLLLSAGFALALSGLVPLSTASLFISFAPGGVTEMSLIALSLGVSPVAVAAHHLFRIVMTVAMAGIAAPRLLRPRA